MKTKNGSKLLAAWLLLAFLVGNPSILLAQNAEVCDNGIDDDGDGLIDLNDSDCDCVDLIANSLIPNPSFEEMTCCPDNEAMLNCAVGWIQASAPTTDYTHICGNTQGNLALMYESPQPYPDGEGCIGFRDGRSNGQPNYKEYAGACLTETMEQGTMYRLDFFVGFHDDPGSLTFDLAVFASVDCDNLPFGFGDFDFGCPTNGPGWDELGEMTVSGMNEWKNVVFEFEATRAYEALVIGPACAPNPNVEQDPYFFFDRLVFAEQATFETPLASIEGNICDGPVTLTAEEQADASYQWYVDGVAIAGATETSLVIDPATDVQGEYVVVVSTPAGCSNSAAFSAVIPNYTAETSFEICPGESIEIGDEVYDEEGLFEATIPASDGCDSTIVFTIAFEGMFEQTIDDSTCEGSYEYNGVVYEVSGTYEVSIDSPTGCDSLITLNLEIGSDTEQLIFAGTCNEVPYILNGEMYTMGGMYFQTIDNAAGCDSTIMLMLTEYQPFFSSFDAMTCEGVPYVWNDVEYSESGVYMQTLVSKSDCDSIVTMTLAVMQDVMTDVSYEVCEGQEVVVNNQSYIEAGQYSQMLTASNGCDSLINISITNSPSVSGQVGFEICEGDEIQVNNEVYNAAGTYTQTLISQMGCDSILTVNVSTFPPMSGSSTFTLCPGESVMIMGESFSTPGVFSQTTIDQNGCPAAMTIIIENFVVEELSEEYEFCLGESITIDGVEYDQPGQYQVEALDQQGCETVLNLNIVGLPGANTDVSFGICDGDEVTVNNETYTLPGSYIQTFDAVNGCDSMLHILVAALEDASFEDFYEICWGDTLEVNGQSYTETGLYPQTFTAANGCDSIFTVNLFVESDCEACIFDQDFNTGEIVINRISPDKNELSLVFDGQSYLNMTLCLEKSFTLVAALLIENEMYYQEGFISPECIVMNEDKLNNLLQDSHWKSTQKFDFSNAQKLALEYPDLHMSQLNFEKLDYLYAKVEQNFKKIKVGGSFAMQLR